MKKFKVTIQPEGKVIYVPANITIKDAVRLSGIAIDTPCGGLARCGRCQVRVVKGLLRPGPQDREFIDSNRLRLGYRLACITKIVRDSAVLIPEEIRLYPQKILTAGREARYRLNPNTRKVFLRLPKPSLDNQISDFQILKTKVFEATRRNIVPTIESLKDLSHIMRSSNFKVTAVLDGDELLGIESGDTRGDCFGASFDVGTTTVCGAIIDLNTGKEVALSSRLNEQAVYGEDVISRIGFTITNKDGLAKLNAKIVDCLNQIVDEAAKKGGINPDNIYDMTVVGNTTMQHLLLGIPPGYLSTSPYTPVLTEPIKLKAREMGIKVNPVRNIKDSVLESKISNGVNRNANIRFLPNIAGFIGSDTVGVILATHINRSRDIKLAIDIGTNGEVILGSRRRLLVASTAAGPAFEGAHIRWGMRAQVGAIESVRIEDKKVFLGVIGGVKPRGICGSGLIDAISEMVSSGIIDKTGRLKGKGFVLYKDRNRKIDLTQKDIREVQLAKAAIRAGIEILKKELKIDDEDISEVLLAGAFGSFIRKESALGIGLIPEFPLEKIKFVGNAAHAGSKTALCSKEAYQEAVEISRDTEYIELCARKDFQKEFTNAISF